MRVTVWYNLFGGAFVSESGIGTRLRELRKKTGESQETVAEACGISRTALARYEIETRKPEIDIASRLAGHFGVSVDYLLGRDEPPSQPAETPAALDRELKAAVDQLPDDASKQDVIDYILFKLGRSKK